MDDLVKQAMVKWPNVPDCYGWLGLDARGDWYMRDDAVQAQGPFAQAKGSRLRHDKLIDFIGRNYAADALGRWFFQNGPQRVFVELEATPWVWRIQADGALQSHTGQWVPMHSVEAVWLDEAGHVLVPTPLGLGRIHTQDVVLVPDWLDRLGLEPKSVLAAQLPVLGGFVPSPALARA